MSARAQVVVHADKGELVDAVAERFVRLVPRLLAQQDVLHIAVTGGSVGIGVLERIKELSTAHDLLWDRLHVWWGDERFVASESPDRNEKQAREALLDHVPIPEHNVHAFPASDSVPDQARAADLYARELASYAESRAWPAFDLTFLGVGPDGHVASLFPGFPQLAEHTLGVAAVQDSPKPPPLRLTLTLPVLNDSRRVWFVLAGADKADALRKALDQVSVEQAPVAGVTGTEETLFMADSEAASLLD